MNEPPDPLEAELRAAFHPVEVSPRLHRAIAEQLAPPAPTAGRRLLRTGFALAAASLAASILAVLLLGRSDEPVDPGSRLPPTTTTTTTPARSPVAARSAPGGIDESLPSLHAYNQAAARSPQDLEALLDRHTARGSGSDSSPVRIYAIKSRDFMKQTISGEL